MQLLSESLPPILVAWCCVVFLLAGVIQGAIGFGFPFIATPLIAMSTNIRTAVVLVLLPTLATTVLNMAKSGPMWPVLARFWMMPLFSLIGSVAGTWLFVAVPQLPYSLLLALLTLGYLNLDRVARGDWPRIRRHEAPIGPLAGFCAGVFEGTVNVGAPPLIIFYLALGLPAAALVQALNICFLVGKTTQLTVLAAKGGVAAADWLATLPFALVGAGAFLIGFRIRNRLDADAFRAWVKRALLVIALALLVQNLYSWI